ncbi:hypothetical protein HBI65_125610 [Parastagonospora nodorum]|nr:hypothetical protein HBI65_125610 [Parastagonospora nodorum]
MCRVHRRVYVREDGHRSTYEEAFFPCEKARKGRLCSNVRTRITEYDPRKGSNVPDSLPSPIEPPSSTTHLSPPSSTGVRVPSSSEHSRFSSSSAGSEYSSSDHSQFSSSSSSWSHSGSARASSFNVTKVTPQVYQDEPGVAVRSSRLAPITFGIQAVLPQLPEHDAVDFKNTMHGYYVEDEEGALPLDGRNRSKLHIRDGKERLRSELQGELHPRFIQTLEKVDREAAEERVYGLEISQHARGRNRRDLLQAELSQNEQRGAHIQKHKIVEGESKASRALIQPATQRIHAPPHVSFPPNFVLKPTSARQSSLSSEIPSAYQDTSQYNPFAPAITYPGPSPAIYQDPWEDDDVMHGHSRRRWSDRSNSHVRSKTTVRATTGKPTAGAPEIDEVAMNDPKISEHDRLVTDTVVPVSRDKVIDTADMLYNTAAVQQQDRLYHATPLEVTESSSSVKTPMPSLSTLSTDFSRPSLANQDAAVLFQEVTPSYADLSPQQVSGSSAVEGSEDRKTIEEEHMLLAPSTSPPPSSYRTQIGNLAVSIRAALVSLGYLETPLKEGYIRLRWQCKCKEKFSGDVFEYREGGVDRLIERMEQSTGCRVGATSYNQATTNQRYAFRTPAWTRGITQKVSSTFKRLVGVPPGLPQHRQAGTSTACALQAIELQTPQQNLHLMACMQRGRYLRTVHQDRIDDISNDQALFTFMQKLLARHRGRIRKIFSLKCVQGIYFVKFRLRAGGSAEVRNHEPCCTSSTQRICECLPPAPKVEPSPDAEYRCAPAGPLDIWPPVLSEELMHMLTSPQCITPKETFVLEQLPKRTKGELIGTIGRPAEGWGIHFQEGWDFDLLIGLVLAVFLLASLLFAVLWSHFKLDVQGAFGVSSYMVTASGIFVAWFANRAGKLG